MCVYKYTLTNIYMYVCIHIQKVGKKFIKMLTVVILG